MASTDEVCRRDDNQQSRPDWAQSGSELSGLDMCVVDFIHICGGVSCEAKLILGLGGHAAFLTAAGYASANVQFNFGDPQFVHDGYTVAPFKVGHPGSDK